MALSFFANLNFIKTSDDIPNIPELQDTPMLLKKMTRSKVFTCTENEGEYINNNNINNNQVLHEMQAMRSFFMDELYEVKNKIKSIDLLNEIEEKGKNDNRLSRTFIRYRIFKGRKFNTKNFINSWTRGKTQLIQRSWR